MLSSKKDWDKVADRVRKFLARAESPEKHEADTAMRMAKDLMEEHGLTEEDVRLEERVSLILDTKRDYCREELAVAVAVSRGCVIAVSKNGMAVRGAKAAAENARGLYLSLSDTVERRSSMLSSGNPPQAARDVWREVFWFGFVEAVRAILRDSRPLPQEVRVFSEKKRAEKYQAEQAPETRSSAVRSVVSHAERLAESVALSDLSQERVVNVVEELWQRAYAAGKMAGANVNVTRWSEPSRSKKLLPG